MHEILQPPDPNIGDVIDCILELNTVRLARTAIVCDQVENTKVCDRAILEEWDLEPLEDDTIEAIRQRVEVYQVKRDLIRFLSELSGYAQTDSEIDMTLTDMRASRIPFGNLQNGGLSFPEWDRYRFKAKPSGNSEGVEFILSRISSNVDGENYSYECYLGVNGEMSFINSDGTDINEVNLGQLMDGLNTMCQLANDNRFRLQDT